MPNYALLVDGERVLRVDSKEDVHAWLKTYLEQHVDDDPSAAHVQILERGPFAWLTGGKLVDRTQFL